MVLPEALQSRVDDLNRRLETFIKHFEATKDKDLSDKQYKAREARFLKICSDTCALVREETANQSPHLPDLVLAAGSILSEAVDYGYGDSEMFDFMPSWAHDEAAGQPLINDNSEIKLPIPSNALQELMQILGVANPGSKLREVTAAPWKDTVPRHPKSSKLARFRPNLPTLTPTPANTIAMRVYDARCEIFSTRATSPIDLVISQDNSCLALLAAGGWKNRSPVLDYYLLDKSEEEDGDQFGKNHFMEPGLAHVASHIAIHESRRLILVGDEDRIKSYAWAAPDGSKYDEPLPTHTLACRYRSGPIGVLPNGNIIRAEKGRVAVWNTDELPTHGPDGDEPIGEEEEDENMLEDTWRDDPEDIETSPGSNPSSYITFSADPDLKLNRWVPRVGTPTTMLCYSEPYDCLTLDLEHQGQVVARYIGHGGKLTDMSVSAGDPNMFLTASTDGFARMYDFRTPLPVLTFDACGQNEPCDAAIIVHPDGIPTVFTGTGRGEQIKLWDVRAKASVYELSTGNNQVQSLAWDSTRNHLYAATECSYQDRMGYRHDYRRLKRSQSNPGRMRSDDEDDEVNEDGEDDDDDDDFDEERAWPKNAWHDEDYFGYVFDAGDNRIYKYAFKEDPDISRLPEYGDATCQGGIQVYATQGLIKYYVIDLGCPKELDEQSEGDNFAGNGGGEVSDDGGEDRGGAFEYRRTWSGGAYQNVHYFGHMFDGGTRGFSQYSFKENTETSVVPN